MENRKHRYIFLDIDGVLAGYEFLKTGKGYIDKENVKLLNQLKDIDCEVVISSSWGYDNGRTEKTLKDCGLELPIVGYTEHYHVDWLCRGNEIEKWLLDSHGGMGTKYGHDYYNKDKYSFVILDDDCDFLLGQAENFIRTNQETGLTQEDIDKAREILMKENNNK